MTLTTVTITTSSSSISTMGTATATALTGEAIGPAGVGVLETAEKIIL